MLLHQVYLRIDLHLEVGAVPFQKLSEDRKGETSAEIKKRVDNCRDIQKRRFQKNSKIYCNAQMGTAAIEKYCQLDTGSRQLLERSVEKLGLSARAYHRILKIARTIGDMEGKKDLQLSHVAEAIQYRMRQYY